MTKDDPIGEPVNRQGACFALAVASLMLPLPAWAQITPLPAADAEAPPVVVTATRYPVDEATVGSSITVITEEDLRQQQSRFVSDILREVPGVAVNRSGTFGALTQVRIRGAEANHTLVIIDGVTVNDPAGGNEFDFSRLLASDIQRIEILRGPQSILYGSNSIGGVINIITKRAEKGATATARVEGGSFHTFDGGASIAGSDGTVGGFVGLSGYRTAGTNISQNGGENDGYDNITLNSNISVTPIPNLEFTGSLRYVDAENQYDDFGPKTDSQGFFVPTDTTNLYQDTTALSGRLQGKLTLFDGMFQNIVGYSGLRTTRLKTQSAH
jgi:vitamin B12 transporter